MTNRAYCRVESDAAAFFTFLQLNGYETFWSPAELERCLMVTILSPDRTLLGVAWAEWDGPGTMRFHGCAAKGARLPFFTSDLVDQLCRLAFAFGADEVVTSHSLNPNRRKLDRFLTLLGFEPRGDGFSRNLWTNNGQQKRQRR